MKRFYVHCKSCGKKFVAAAPESSVDRISHLRCPGCGQETQVKLLARKPPSASPNVNTGIEVPPLNDGPPLSRVSPGTRKHRKAKRRVVLALLLGVVSTTIYAVMDVSFIATSTFYGSLNGALTRFSAKQLDVSVAPPDSPAFQVPSFQTPKFGLSEEEHRQLLALKSLGNTYSEMWRVIESKIRWVDGVAQMQNALTPQEVGLLKQCFNVYRDPAIKLDRELVDRYLAERDMALAKYIDALGDVREQVSSALSDLRNTRRELEASRPRTVRRAGVSDRVIRGDGYKDYVFTTSAFGMFAIRIFDDDPIDDVSYQVAQDYYIDKRNFNGEFMLLEGLEDKAFGNLYEIYALPRDYPEIKQKLSQLKEREGRLRDIDEKVKASEGLVGDRTSAELLVREHVESQYPGLLPGSDARVSVLELRQLLANQILETGNKALLSIVESVEMELKRDDSEYEPIILK